MSNAGRQVVLLEITPSVSLSGWTLHSGAAYKADLSRFFAAGTVSIYRKTVGVRQDATDLSEVADAAAVVAAAGTWYHDAAAGVLYVRAVGGTDPGTLIVQAFVRYHFGTEGRVIAATAGAPDGAVYYLPWLVDLPRISRSVSDLLFGATQSEAGDAVVTNGHGAWHYLIPAHNWHNKRAELLFADFGTEADVARDAYSTLATMLIQGPPGADEETATIRLAGQASLLDKQLPARRFRAADYAHLGDGVAGTAIPLLWGRRSIQPPLTDSSGSGVYTLADSQAQTLLAVHGVTAISKADGSRTALTVTTHYTANLSACTVTLTGTGGYNATDYLVEVDATGKPDAGDPTVAIETGAAIVRDIIETHLALAAADIDTAAFDQAELDAEAPLAVYLAAPRSIASIFSTAEPNAPSIEKSILARIRQNTAGQWSIAVWNYGQQLAAVTMAKKHFAAFRAEPKTAAVASVARVYYAQDGAGAWESAESTDLETRYLAETRNEEEFYTFLREETDAEDHAERARLLLSAAGHIEIEFAETGSRLRDVLAGDFVPVTFAPAPVAGQAFDETPLEVARLDLALAPTLQISGRFLDLRSLQGRIGVWMDDTAPDWSTATEAERVAAGFWCDDDGLVDPSDPTTEDLSIWW